MTAYLQIVAFAALACIIYGVYKMSEPWAWVVGGSLLFLYAEVSLRAAARVALLAAIEAAGDETDTPGG